MIFTPSLRVFFAIDVGFKNTWFLITYKIYFPFLWHFVFLFCGKVVAAMCNGNAFA
jgi:hypothetical protein